MISVVIPSYQRKESVLELLATVYQQRQVDFEVILVDDNSTDGTSQAVTERYPQTNVLRETANRGPAASRNRGIQQARGDLIVGLDNDATLPATDVLKKVKDLFEVFPSVDGWAFRILRPDGIADDIERWWHPRPIAGNAALPFVTDYFSGTAFAFRKKAVCEAGLFPEIFFQYYEENSVALRLIDNGATIVYCPNLAVLHHAPVGRQNARRRFYQPRNQILLALSCYPVIRGLLFVTPRIAYRFLRAILEGYLPTLLRALWSAATLLPHVWSRRKPLKSATWRLIADIRKGNVALPIAADASLGAGSRQLRLTKTVPT